MKTTTAPARPASCAVCKATGAEWSVPFMMPLCPDCTRAGTGSQDRDPVRLGDVLPVTAAALLRAERRTARFPGPDHPGKRAVIGHSRG